MEKQVQNLLTQVSIISKKYDEIATITGENFNIFKILKMETKEVKTHSAFLAELLNPKGSHGQGDTFLELFIAEINETNIGESDLDAHYNQKFDIRQFETSNAKTNVEFHIGETTDTEGGRIDILITSNTAKIIIENKIYAGDQPFQLVRYNNFDVKAPLYYLTLSQNTKPQEMSIKSQDKELKEKEHYKRISYENEILNWLEKCREKAVNHALLRETITQYINLIKYLTGKTLNSKMEEELIKTILHSEETLKSFYDLKRIHEDKVEQVLLSKLEQDLKSFAGEKGFECDFEIKKYEEGSGIYFTNPFLKENDLGIYFEFEYKKYESFYFGFYNKEINQKNEEKIRLISVFQNKFKPSETTNGNWIAWRYHEDRNWNSDTFLKIQSGEMAKDLMEKLGIMFAIVIAEQAKTT